MAGPNCNCFAKKKKKWTIVIWPSALFFWACRGNGHVEWLCKSLALYSSLAESSVLLIDTFFVFTRYAGSPSLLVCNVMDKIHPCRLFRSLIGAIFLMPSGSFCDPRSNFLFFFFKFITDWFCSKALLDVVCECIEDVTYRSTSLSQKPHILNHSRRFISGIIWSYCIPLAVP